MSSSSSFIPKFEDDFEETNSRGECSNNSSSSDGSQGMASEFFLKDNQTRTSTKINEASLPPPPLPTTTQNLSPPTMAVTATTECSDFMSSSSCVYDDGNKPTLYTFSSDTVAGQCLTWLSNLFLPSPHYHHHHSHTLPTNSKANRGGTIHEYINSDEDMNCKRNTNNIDKSEDDSDLSTAAAEATTTTPTKTTHIKHGAAFVAFLSLLLVTFANNMLAPMRDAAALALGVNHIPNLTLASTLLAFCSSVPMGWLFEAPNPDRKGKRWRDRVGLTRGETQGTSLALFYRIFAILLVGYALGFQLVDYVSQQQSPTQSFISTLEETESKQAIYIMSCFQGILKQQSQDIPTHGYTQSLIQSSSSSFLLPLSQILSTTSCLYHHIQYSYFTRAFFHQALSKFWAIFYIAFYLVGNLMKLYSVSLLWGVATEAMEYEEQAELRYINSLRISNKQNSLGRDVGGGGMTSPERRTHANNINNPLQSSTNQNPSKKGKGKQSRTRLERLEFVGFGSTLGGILGRYVFVVINR